MQTPEQWDAVDMSTATNLWEGGVRRVDFQGVLNTKFESISGKTWEEKLYSCIACNCCTRHMTNRPIKLSPWVETPFSYTEKNTCVCHCRHNARYICRQVREPVSNCPMGSPREVDQVIDVLTPGERMAWLEHLDGQEMEAAMQNLTTN